MPCHDRWLLIYEEFQRVSLTGFSKFPSCRGRINIYLSVCQADCFDWDILLFFKFAETVGVLFYCIPKLKKLKSKNNPMN